jgi:hypothetical protein
MRIKYFISLAICFLSSLSNAQKSDPFTISSNEVDEITWVNKITSAINMGHYQYYALFAGLNCIYPNVPPSRVNEIILDFEAQFARRVEADPFLKYRPDDVMDIAFGLMSKMPEIGKVMKYTKKAFSYYSSRSLEGVSSTQALYTAAEVFNFDKIRTFGKEQCSELYKFIRLNPEYAKIAYDNLIQHKFGIHVDDRAITILTSKKDRNKVDDLLLSHMDNSGNVKIGHDELNETLKEMEKSLNLRLDRSLTKTLSLIGGTIDKGHEDDINEVNDHNTARAEIELTLNGLNVLANVFALSGNRKVAEDLTFMTSFGSNFLVALNKYNESIENDAPYADLIFSGNMINMVMGVANYFIHKDDTTVNQIILQELATIRNALNKLYSSTQHRFDLVDMELKAIFTTMIGYFDRLILSDKAIASDLNDMKIGIYRLQGAISVFRYDFDRTEIEKIYGQLNSYIQQGKKSNYSSEYKMSEYEFNTIQNNFEYFASTAAKLPSFSIAQSDRDNLLNQGIDKNLNVFLAELIRVVCTNDSCDLNIPFLYNPILLSSTAHALMDFWADWPEHKKIARISVINAIEKRLNETQNFINVLRKTGGVTTYAKICEALKTNYTKQVKATLKFIDEQERLYLEQFICRNAKTRSRCLQFRPYKGIWQITEPFKFTDFSPPYYINGKYPDNIYCYGDSIPLRIRDSMAISLPSFLKIYHMMGLGVLQEPYADGIYLNNIFATKIDRKYNIRASFETLLSCRLSTSLVPGQRGIMYYLGRLYNVKQIDFGIAALKNASAHQLQDRINGNCEKLKKLFLESGSAGDSLIYQRIPDGLHVKILLERFKILNQRDMMFGVFSSLANYKGNNEDTLIAKFDFVLRKPFRDKLRDTLITISNKMSQYLLSSKVSMLSEYNLRKIQLDKSRNMILNFIQLTSPISYTFRDSLRIRLSLDSIPNTISLFGTYAEKTDSLNETFNVETTLLGPIVRNLNSLSNALEGDRRKQNKPIDEIYFLDLNKTIRRIHLFKELIQSDF